MRTRRVVAAVAVVGVALAGCTSDDGALDLTDDDGGTAAPVEPEPPVEVTEDPDPPPPDDDEEPLYPPLPRLEPDPDSDIPVEMQEAALELHSNVYRMTQTALHTNEFDPEELASLLHGDLLEQTIRSFEDRRARGVISRSPDTEVRYVEVVEAQGGPFWIHECSIVGPDTTTYDAETGERLAGEDRDEAVAVLLEVEYALVELEPGSFDYRALSVEAIEPRGDCVV